MPFSCIRLPTQSSRFIGTEGKAIHSCIHDSTEENPNAPYCPCRHRHHMLALSSASRAADGSIHIVAEVPYRDGVGGQLIRDECAFGKDITDSIVYQARGQVVVASGDVSTTSGKWLDVVITKAHAAGGGAPTGPKWGRIYGELKEDGRVVGNFTFKRTTSRPFTFRACTTLKLITDALGKDVAKWLQAPTFDPNLNMEAASN